MRLQSKFLSLLLPAGLAATALILFLIRGSVHSIIFSELEKNAVLFAKAAAQDSAQGFEARSEGLLLPMLQSLQKREGALYAAAVASDATILAHTTITEKGKSLDDFVTLEGLRSDQPVVRAGAVRGEPVLEVAVPVFPRPMRNPGELFLLSGEPRLGAQKRLGILKLGLPLRQARETESRIIGRIFMIVFVIGGAALGLVLLLVRGILRPVTRMMAGIARIGLGEYDVAVPVLSTDELGDLASSLNRMSGELARTTVSKEYVEGILENMLDMLVVADPALRIETMNRAAQEALAVGVSEMVGRPLAELFQDDRGEIEALVRSGGARDIEATLQTRSGRGIPALFSASVLKGRDGRLRGYIGVAKDIAERKRAEEALLKAKTAAEASNKELEAFSYSVAHDLRAPLRAIDGFSKILLDTYTDKLDEQGRAFLTRVRVASGHMGQLISDLLNLSRITRSTFQAADVDLSALAREIAAELQKSQPERTAEFVIPDGLVCQGDAALLRVAFVNLLSNSWKYTGKRSSARIEFGATRQDGATVYFVRDNGAGFDMAYAKKLFKAFSRLHAASEFEGTGIGLATVQRVVERHGGRIWGEGAVGRGATFFFTLWEGNRNA